MYRINIICVTLANGLENYTRKYVTEVQRENSMKFNYYSEWILVEKLLKSSRVWKNDQHGKVVCLQQLSIGISLAQFRWGFQWVDGELWAKKAREKQSEVQGFIPRSSSTSCDAFWRVCFAIKAERMISPFLKLLKNGLESDKTVNMKKFCIFRSFSMVYYLPHSDKICKNYNENKFFYPFSKLT